MGDELLCALLAVEAQVAGIVRAIQDLRRLQAEQGEGEQGSEGAGREDGAGRFL